MMKKFLALALLLSIQAQAQVTLPWIFTPGETIASSQVNANFSALASEINAVETIGNVLNWTLNGNSGTTAGTNFIGTTDAQDLVFKTNGVEYFRITSAGVLTAAGLTTGVAHVGPSGAITSSPVVAGDISGTLPASAIPTPTYTSLGGVFAITGSSNQFVTGIAPSGAVIAAQPAFTNISGSISPTQLPPATVLNIGGIQAITGVSHKWINSISQLGVPNLTQPAFSDVSGTATSAQLPTPTTSAIGGVQAITGVSHQWINSISQSGVPALSQPAFTDISGSATGAQLPSFTGDVSNSSAAMTVVGIDGTAVSGVTGTQYAVLSNAPGISAPVITGATTITDGAKIVNASDTTKAITFSLGGATTGTTLTITSSQSGSHVITIPAIGLSDTFATLLQQETFSGNNTHSGTLTLGSGTSQQHTLNTKVTTGSQTATLGTNGPGATTPQGWIQITINGSTRYIPFF